ncbi:MAG: tRNA (cytidine(34)-2'-O)-methyltransferase [Magnetococcales bacterium]|nr:tRNA (cytidine(34)-2'-O)-methyltransferase [Magnetococcales bacterium]
MHIVLHRPEIPPNTGNIQRICAVTGAILHLVGPIKFRMDEASVKRAGLDYREWAEVRMYDDWHAYSAQHPPDERLFALSSKGEKRYADINFQPGDRLLFGSESKGLPPELHQVCAGRTLRIPMTQPARSLNLANCVSIVLYEALRQQNFTNLIG